MHLCGIFDLAWMVGHGRLLHRIEGLTRFLGAFGRRWVVDACRVRDVADFLINELSAVSYLADS